jgi:ADP-ribose pyrophosphatase YjhB (NUDIX family)
MWIGGARAVILDEKKRVLMVRQHHEGKDIWMLPGGGIEKNEDSRQAAAREIKEETGLDVEIGMLIWHVEQIIEGKEQRFVNFFMGEVMGGSLKKGDDPEREKNEQVIREVRFMDREEIKKTENLYPEYLRDELWGFIESGTAKHEVFKIRR